MGERRGFDDSLRDPWFLGALAIILLNDLVFKAVWPGPVSGKLSDVAGMVVFPCAALALARRCRLPVKPVIVLGLITGWFVGLQISTTIDLIHEELLSFVLPWEVVNTADPTDLVALLVLPVAYRVLNRPRPITLRTGAARAVWVVLVCACLADTGPDADRVGPPVVDEDGIVQVLRSGHLGEGRYQVDDGGLLQAQVESLDRAAVDEALTAMPGTREACLRGQPAQCFRLGETVFAIEESSDGGDSWRTSWEANEDRYLLREQGNSFQFYDERQRGIAILPDDSVLVTTAIGPMLTWSASDGWSPTPRSLRQQFWPYFVAAGLLATSALLLPLLGLGVGRSIIGSVFGLVAAIATALWSIVDFFLAVLVGGIAVGAGVLFAAFLLLGLLSARRRGAWPVLAGGRWAIVVAAVLVGVVPLGAWLFLPSIELSTSLFALSVVGAPMVILLAAAVDVAVRASESE